MAIGGLFFIRHGKIDTMVFFGTFKNFKYRNTKFESLKGLRKELFILIFLVFYVAFKIF